MACMGLRIKHLLGTSAVSLVLTLAARQRTQSHCLSKEGLEHLFLVLRLNTSP